MKNISLTITSLLISGIAPISGADCYAPQSCETACCETGCNISLWGEFLYWRPELCGLESAFGDTTIATSVNGDVITTAVTESDEEPHSKWSPGFRIGADAHINCLDLCADWTHFHGRANFHDHDQHGHWKITYDVIDLTVGRAWYPAPCLSFEPYVGLRAAFIHQSLKAHLETLFTSTLIGSNTVITDKSGKDHFWGIGPEIGFEAEWSLGCNFSIYGSFDVVAYYGDAKSTSYKNDTFTSTVSICNDTMHHCFNNIATDIAVGVRWDKTVCFCNRSADLMFKLGLEQHRIYSFSNFGSDSTLSLDGGIFAAGINFCF